MPLDIQIIDLVIQLLNKIEFWIKIKFEILFFCVRNKHNPTRKSLSSHSCEGLFWGFQLCKPATS